MSPSPGEEARLDIVAPGHLLRELLERAHWAAVSSREAPEGEDEQALLRLVAEKEHRSESGARGYN